MPAHWAADMAPVPESVSQSIRTSSARSLKPLFWPQGTSTGLPRNTLDKPSKNANTDTPRTLGTDSAMDELNTRLVAQGHHGQAAVQRQRANGDHDGG